MGGELAVMQNSCNTVDSAVGKAPAHDVKRAKCDVGRETHVCTGRFMEVCNEKFRLVEQG